MEEQSDPHVGANGPKHRRHHLQLVVVDPDDGIRLGPPSGVLRKPAVDGDVCIPPRPVVLRADDRVVIQGPECRVAETFVEQLHFATTHLNGVEENAVDSKRVVVLAGDAGPADPRRFSGVRLQDRPQGGNKASRARLPLASVAGPDASDRQTVRENQQPRSVGRRSHRLDPTGAIATRGRRDRYAMSARRTMSARSPRARATRERIVPIGHPITTAASS